MNKRGRQPLPPGQRREHFTLRLPANLVAWIDSQGQRGRVIEEAVRQLKESRNATDPVSV